ncbi:MAG: SUMF1/EgtB/PvdO family nonheme iron enzyme [Caldilineaceae bacterium]
MDISQWQEQIKTRLTSWLSGAQAALPNTAYGFISAAALAPLVSAVAAGDPTAYFTLGTVLSGLGGNLLANQLQKWVDQQNAAPSDQAFAQDLAVELAQFAHADAQWRDALDEVHAKLASLELMPANIHAEARSWFVQTLREEVAQLGNQEKFAPALVQIEQSGSGAVAMQGGTAAGKQGIAAHSMTNPINVTGDNAQITVQQLSAPHPQSPTTDPQEPLFAYLHALRKECNALPLAALGGNVSSGAEVCLDDVYIELDTDEQVALTEQEKAELRAQNRRVADDAKRPLKTLEAAQQHAHLLLLGDPGSGKSTFVRQWAGRHAAALLGGQAQMLPIFVVLHELIEGLDQLAQNADFQQGRQRQRQRMLREMLQAEWTRRLDEWEAADFEAELLARAKAKTADQVLLVLDGLDEIPEPLRPILLEMMGALGDVFTGIGQIIVTCRSRSYWDGMLPGYKAVTLAPFTDAQINRFIADWYGAQQKLGRMDQRRAEQNIADLQTAARTNLRELAGNPMLLTTMTIIHQRETRLPDQRVELYSLAVEVLTQRWQQGKDQVANLSDALNALLGDMRKLRRILELLAYQAHKTQASAAAGDAEDEEGANRNRQQPLRRGDLLVLLENQLDDDNALANEFLDYIDHRAGLLVGRGGQQAAGSRKPPTYSFPHRTFQEYLAGCHMNRGREYVRTYLEHVKEGDYWRVAALLGAEELFYNNDNENAVLDLAYALCPVAEPKDDASWRSVVWAAQMAALLERAAIESDEKPDGGPAFLSRLLERLVQLPHTPFLSMTERAEAGAALGQLGDPRFDPNAWHLPNEVDLGFVDIAAGTFIMGSDKKVDRRAHSDEQPQHELHLDRFLISRYQVTVAQWRAFCDAADHTPEHAGSLRDPDNNPVRYVSWKEAMDYCAWLTKRLRTWDHTPEPLATLLRQGDENGQRWQITLPSEAQWERAARNGWSYLSVGQ